MSNDPRRRSRLIGAVAPVLAVLAVVAVAAVPASASAAKAERCSKAGRTLAVHGKESRPYSYVRVWRQRGNVYGCAPSNGFRTRYITRGAISDLTLDGALLAWTTRTKAGGPGARRVSAFDLSDNRRTLNRVAAVPKRSATAPRRNATVDGLLVRSDGVIAWIAGGTTVVIGDSWSEEVELSGTTGASTSLYEDRGLTAVATYPSDPSVAKSLADSLDAKIDGGRPDDSLDPCSVSRSVTFTWAPTRGRTAEARSLGSRDTPDSPSCQ